MLRKTAATIAAIGATLALGATAAPANADSVGTQAVIGTAWDDVQFNGNTGALSEDADCLDIPSITTARSAENNAALPGGQTITLYRATPSPMIPACAASNILAVLPPQTSDSGEVVPGVPNLLGRFGAVRYSSA